MKKTKLLSLMIVSAAFVMASCSSSSSDASSSSKSSASKSSSSSSTSLVSETSTQASDSADSDSQSNGDDSVSSAFSTSISEGTSVTSNSAEDQVVYTATVNGVAATLTSVADYNPADNKAAFTISLAAEDVLIIKENDTALNFKRWDYETEAAVDYTGQFTAFRTGLHTIWIGLNGENWVNVPAADLHPTIKINDAVSTVLTEVEHGANDMCHLYGHLSEGDKVELLDGENALHFYSSDATGDHDDGAVYYAPVTGTYDFYVNSKKEVWVSAVADQGSGTSQDVTSQGSSTSEEVAAKTWYIVGEGSFITGSATWASSTGILMTKQASSLDPNALEEYHSLVHFEKDDKWKIMDGGSIWVEMVCVEEGTGSALTAELMHKENGNIVVDEEGDYDIYFKTYEGANVEGTTGYSVWVEAHPVEE